MPNLLKVHCPICQYAQCEVDTMSVVRIRCKRCKVWILITWEDARLVIVAESSRPMV